MCHIPADNTFISIHIHASMCGAPSQTAALWYQIWNDNNGGPAAAGEQARIRTETRHITINFLEASAAIIVFTQKVVKIQIYMKPHQHAQIIGSNGPSKYRVHAHTAAAEWIAYLCVLCLCMNSFFSASRSPLLLPSRILKLYFMAEYETSNANNISFSNGI